VKGYVVATGRLMAVDLVVHVLPDSGDARGSSFSLPVTWLSAVQGAVDLHVTGLAPGYVRGDHYHLVRRELLMVLHEADWTLYWDSGAGSAVSQREFQGAGAVLIEVPVGVAHAVRNRGPADLRIIGISDGSYDPAVPDAYPRKVS
jgi:dTDP-4-dehydrorhamnose 3,5-epimerase-like enzyme